MRANRPHLSYDDHERALKVLYALDRKVWDVKVFAIIEFANYDTLTVDELFSKLKFTEIDCQTQAKIKNPSAPTIALVSDTSSSSSLANPSQMSFALSSLVSVTEEQMKALGDDELALVISRFSRFHNNRLNRRRGGPDKGCFGCRDPEHFIASCPKSKNKHASDKYDSGKHKDKREYISSKHKFKGGFDNEAIKHKYLTNAKAKQRAFLVSLSDLDIDFDDHRSSPLSSDDESERKREDRLMGLCFFADSTHGGFLRMLLQYVPRPKMHGTQCSYYSCIRCTVHVSGVNSTYLCVSSLFRPV
jgi:hypothetical protein